MNKALTPNLALSDEETLTDELPDVALEGAASQVFSGNPYTLAFCSGLSSCPFGAPDSRFGGPPSASMGPPSYELGQLRYSSFI